MEEQTRVLEYKCPCCNAGLHFGSDAQKLTCEYCGNTFDIDTVRAFNESQKPPITPLQSEARSPGCSSR